MLSDKHNHLLINNMKYMTRIRILMLFLLTVVFNASTSAKFVQEIELKDGTVLVGHVYRQRPGKFIVFHADRAKKDPKKRYKIRDNDYTLQWKDVKYIRRSRESETPWCNDKVTLKDGTTYIGIIEEQQLGVQMKLRQNSTGSIVTISYNKLKTIEKKATGIDKDLWVDRQYTDRLKLSDNSIREGLIVLQYLGDTLNDCYVELMHDSAGNERIYFPEISEFLINLK